MNTNEVEELTQFQAALPCVGEVEIPHGCHLVYDHYSSDQGDIKETIEWDPLNEQLFEPVSWAASSPLVVAGRIALEQFTNEVPLSVPALDYLQVNQVTLIPPFMRYYPGYGNRLPMAFLAKGTIFAQDNGAGTVIHELFWNRGEDIWSRRLIHMGSDVDSVLEMPTYRADPSCDKYT